MNDINILDFIGEEGTWGRHTSIYNIFKARDNFILLPIDFR